MNRGPQTSMSASDEDFCLITGYSYSARNGTQIRRVPPLPADLVTGVRRAAAVVLARHRDTATPEHLRSHGQQAPAA